MRVICLNFAWPSWKRGAAGFCPIKTLVELEKTFAARHRRPHVERTTTMVSPLRPAQDFETKVWRVALK